MPLYKSTKATLSDFFQLSLNRTWRAQLTVTGIEGLPEPKIAGNVLKPFTNVKLSLRCPPTLDVSLAKDELKKLLEENPPYDAEVIFDNISPGNGWNTPAMSKNLRETLNQASLV